MSDTLQDDTIALCTSCKEPLPADGSPCSCRSGQEAGDTTVRPGVGPRDEASVIRAALDPEYEVLEEIGRGGMAIVYRAVERALEREVAIKVLPLAMTFDQELVERFKREARTAAALAHPHIIPIYRVGQVGQVCFLVMKLIDGPTLTELLDRGDPLPASLVRRMLIEVGEALDFAHQHGVVHRDIKPDNVMRDGTDRFVVADFGIAKSRQASSLTQTGSSIGTPRYMSPEQGTGRPVDGRSDLYSLGVVAYHCLAGRPPFDGPDPLSVLHGHVSTPVPDPGLTDSDARALFPVVRMMMEKNPARRPGSGAAVAELIQGRTASTASTATSAAGASLPTFGRALLGGLRGAAATRPRAWGLGSAAALVLVLVLSLMVATSAERRCREAVQGEDAGIAVLIEDPGSVDPDRPGNVDFIVCGLAESAPFTGSMEIAPEKGGGVIGGVRRLFGGRDETVTTWEDRADGVATSRSRSMAAGKLGEGDHRLTITISAEDGREARTTRRFEVVE